MRVKGVPILPEVTVHALDPDTEFTEGDAVAFTLVRSGSTTDRLTVDIGLEATSTGENGIVTAEAISQTTATFAANEETATVTVQTRNNETYSATPETVTISLTPVASPTTATPRYAVGTPSTAEVRIADDDPAATVTGVAVTSTAPRYREVSGANVRDVYGAGDVIEFTVTFSDTVDVDTTNGVPTLTFSLGNANAVQTSAPYARGSGTNKLVFAHAVQAADSDSNGIFLLNDSNVPGGALQRNGGVLGAGINGVVSTAIATRGARPAHKVDGSRSGPYVESLAVTSTPQIMPAGDTVADTYGAGEAIEFTLALSEAVTVTGTPHLQFSLGGTNTHAGYARGSGTDKLVFAYMVQSSDSDADGIFVQDGEDVSGNSAVVVESGEEIDAVDDSADADLVNPGRGTRSGHRVDGSMSAFDTAAVLSIVRQDPADSPTNADTLTWRVTFSEDVANVDAADFMLSGTTATPAVAEAAASTIFDVTASGGDLAVLDGTVTLGFAPGQDITDTADPPNALTATTPTGTDERSWVVDNTAPTVTIEDVPATSDAPFMATFTFSEPVTGFTLADIAVGNGTVSEFTNTETGTTWTAKITHAAAGEVTVDVAADAAEDEAGNGNVAGEQAVSAHSPAPATVTGVAVSSTAPRYREVHGANVKDVYGAGDAIEFTVTFSAAVDVDTTNGVPTLTFSLGGTDTSADYVRGSGTGTLVFAYAVQAADSDTNGISLLNDSGVTGGALRLNGGVLSAGTSGVVSTAIATRGARPAHKVDGSRSGPYVESLAVTSTPRIMRTGEPVADTYGAGETIEFTLALSEAVTVTGTPHLQFSLGGTNTHAGYARGSGTDKLVFAYAVQAGDADADGIFVQDGEDVSGNSAVVLDTGEDIAAMDDSADADLVNPGRGTRSGHRVDGSMSVFDTAAPTVLSIVHQDPADSPTNADTLTWRVTFSEDVTNVDATDFTLTGTTATPAVAVATASTVFDVTASGGDLAELDGTVTLGFAPGQDIADTADTPNALADTAPTGTDERSYDLDNTAPTVTITVPETSDAPFMATFTFAEPVTGFTVKDITVGNGTVSEFTNTETGTTWTAKIAPAADGEVTVDVAADAAADAAGNGNAAAEQASSTYAAPNAAPAFDEGELTRSVAENAGPGTNVGAAIPPATDGDGDALTYAMGGADAASFDFDATTRQVATKAGVDYDFEAQAMYSVTIEADDGKGGTATVAVTITLTDVAEPPDAPEPPAVTATPGSTTSLEVSWSAPANTGRPDIAGYDLRYCAGQAADCTADSDFTDGPQDVTGTSAAIPGLAEGTAYQVQVRAGNDEGDGGWSDSGGGSTAAPVDATAPTVLSIVRHAPADSPTNADSLTWRVTFSEDVQNVDGADFAVTGTTAALTVAEATASTVFDVTASGGDLAGLDGTVTLGFGSGQDIADEADNALADTAPTGTDERSYDLDNTAPTVTIATLAAANAPFTATFTFSEPVTGFVLADIAVGNGTASAFTETEEGTTWTATITPVAEGAVTLDVAADVAEDDAGNGNEAAEQVSVPYAAPNTPPTAEDGEVETAEDTPYPFKEADFGFADEDAGDALASVRITDLETTGDLELDGTDVTVDQVIPRADIDGGRLIFTPAANANGDAYATFTFKVSDGTDDSVAEYTMTIDVTAANDAPTVASEIEDQTVTAGEAFSFTVPDDAFDDIDGDKLEYSAMLDDSSALPDWLTFTAATRTFMGTPGAGDTGTLAVKVTASDGTLMASDVFDIVVSQPADTTAPTVESIVRQDPAVSPTNADALTWRVTFSEDVANVDVADFAVTGTSAALAVAEVTASTVYDVTASGGDLAGLDGPVTLGFAATQDITDTAAAANALTETAPTGTDQRTYDVDNTAPTATITGVPAAVNAPFTATFTFSEPVTGFVLADIAVGNGTASDFAGGDGDTAYTATVTPGAEGAVTLDVAADVAEDAAGNGNLAAAQASASADLTAPTVESIVRHAPAVSPTNADSLTWRVTFSEDVANVDAADFAVTGTTATVTGVQAVSGETGLHDVTVSGGNLAGLDGTVTLGFGSGQDIADEAGNALAATAPTSTDERSWVVDNAAPTVMVSAPAATNAPFTATFTFSEPVTGFAVEDIAVGNGTASEFTNTETGTTWTALITPSADGEVTVDVAADVAEDEAGNGSLAATRQTVDHDATAPTVLSVVRHDPAVSPTNADALTWRVTFSEDVQNVDAADFAVTGSTATVTGVQAVSGETGVHDVTASGGNLAGYSGTVTLGFGSDQDIADEAGNALADTAPAGTDERSWVVDNTAPTVTIGDVPATSDGPFTATFAFSEAVTGFTVEDITVGNGTASDLAGGDGDTVYTATITPTADGEVTVDVAADVAEDEAGNGNTAAAQASSAHAVPNTPPAARDGMVTTEEDTPYPFTAGDFNFTDADSGDTLASVKITQLESAGDLKLDGTDVTLDQVIQKADIDAGKLVFTPAANSNGTGYATFRYRVNDGTDDSDAEYTMAVDVNAVNDAPAVANPIPNQSATAGAAFSFTVPDDAFEDVDGDTLTYTATQGDDSGLPDWLAFDAATRTFTGTPGAGDTGTLAVEVTAEDGDGETASDAFDIVVNAAPNAAPAFADAALTRSVAENAGPGTNVGAAIPPATDGDGDALTYAMGGADAASFDFDATTRQVATKAGVDYDFEAQAMYSVTIEADDGKGGTATVAVTITLTDVAEPPDAPEPPAVTATPGSTTSLEVSWSAPANTGRPDIAGYDLRYCAGQAADCTADSDFTDGPQDVTGTSAAIPGLAEGTAYQVQVRASNDEGDSEWSMSGDGSTAMPVNTPPTASDGEVTAEEDTPYAFSVADFNFDDADAGDTLASVRIVTLPGAGALTLDGAAVAEDQEVPAADLAKLVYAPPADANADGRPYASFTFKVSDGTDESADTYTMAINVTPENDAPTVANGIADQAATAGVPFSFTVPANTFEDIDGDPLEWEARLPDDAALPSWLVFDDTTLTFEGTPGAGDTGTLIVKVSVSDGTLEVSDQFNIVVSPAADTAAPTVLSVVRHDPAVSPTNADTLTWRVTFSEDVANVDQTDFTVSGTTAAPAVTEATASTVFDVTASGGDLAGLDGTVTLTLAAAQDIADLSPTPNPLTEIEPTGANDNSYELDNSGPALLSAVVEGTTLTLLYDQPLDAGSVPAAGDYSVSVDGTAAAPSAVALTGSQVELTLGAAPAEDAAVTVTYTVPATNPVRDGVGNEAAALSAQTVTRSLIRLEGGTGEHEGRVEVFHAGAWGTVCDDYWDKKDADVACRMAGYDAGSVADAGQFRRAHFGEGPLEKIWLDNLRCTGDETSLFECRRARSLAVGEHNCKPRENVGVRCLVTGETAPPRVQETNGIELNAAPGGSWSAGETVEVTLVWSEAVTVATPAGGEPPKLWIGFSDDEHLDNSGVVRRAVYARGSGTVSTVFAYTLKAGYAPFDSTGAGGDSWRPGLAPAYESVRVYRNSLRLRDGTIVSEGGVDAELAHLGHPTAAPQLEAPRVAGVPAVSGPGPDGLWTPGETVEVGLAFDRQVFVAISGGAPSLEIGFLNGQKRRAPYSRGTGTQELIFAYTLAEADEAQNAILVTPDSLALGGGRIRGLPDGGDAALGHEGAAVLAPPVQDPPPVSFTGSFSGVAAEHDGETPFVLGFAFSEAPKEPFSFRTVRNSLFAVSGGSIQWARRKVKGESVSWNLTVRPGGDAGVTLTMRETGSCDASGAVCTEDGRPLSGQVSATVPGPATVSVADAEVDEGTGPLEFRVTLSRARTEATAVDYATSDVTATAGEDYTETAGTLTFDAGVTERTVSVPVLDDTHDEGEETLTLTLSNPVPAAYVRIGDGTATGTIVNEDPMPQAWIARFGRTLAEQVLDAVEGRMRAPRTAGAEVSLGGQRIGLAPVFGGKADPGDRAAREARGREAEARGEAEAEREARRLADWFRGETSASRSGAGEEDGRGEETRTLTGRELTLGSSFALTAAADGGAGGSMSLWGRSAVSRFDGREGDLTLDGEVVSGFLGWDWSLGPEPAASTLGLILGHSRGEGGYRAPSGGGTVSSTLTGLYPWGRQALSERVSMWAAAGYGEGTLTLTPEGHPAMRTDLDLAMGALGLRGVAVMATRTGGPEVAVTADAMGVRTTTAAVDGLAAAEAEVTRLRLGLEAAWPVRFADGAALVPSLELGLRHDGGDAETGYGADLGGGVAWSDPGRGISAEFRGRGLLSHEATGFRERGLSGALSWEPVAGGRGPRLSLTQTVGGASRGGMYALLERETLAGLAANDNGDDLRQRRLELRFGYGFGAFGDRFTWTPEAGFGLSDGGRDYTLGWRLLRRSTASDIGSLELSFDARRQESANDTRPPEHAAGLRLISRF